ncbi:MAG: PAS domain S-box protein [Candidatus Thermoplasmatota archaeon]|nr:PAS domain S-box protein [Euryarchaeota archaeon]MBU4031859.1 PAS domain S-box protein [Candidatus Thermoplasmatota archaeon]MBU4072368.1 PAS domain S-box protein [Candidatus Thermoplasmatota archaeon]MBU4143838.1 PAS domain S-box protein [Candidatus Thermoplasmatota archaeon]MBU4591905.1 PAS domain S-box protein [Candidatus Thermoplasmatota archaeon]
MVRKTKGKPAKSSENATGKKSAKPVKKTKVQSKPAINGRFPIVGIASTECDITERTREVAALRRFAAVVRDSNDAVTIQDFKGNITAWNHGAELMYGYTEEEALRKNINLLTTPQKVEEQTEFTRRLIAGETITSFETQRVTKDGGILDVWMTVTKLVDESGKSIGIASTERDITERKKLENSIKECSENLQIMVDKKTIELDIAHDKLLKQERLAVLGQMAASVSHELRNPLTVINSVSYYLKTKFPDMDEKTFKMLDLLEKEVDRSDRIIGNMLNFSRQKPNILEDINLNTHVTEYFSSSENIAGDITLKLKLSDNLPLIQADAEKLRQILDNLVSNACDAMSEGGGTLTVTTGINDNFVNLSVKDIGHGMSPEIQARIFEPLFSTRTTGFGLGLPIVKTLVEDHGGEITVNSKEGQGTEFTLTFPMDAEEKKEESDTRGSD